MWKKLLVPHDFSPCAARALDTALALARVHGSELVLVHVSDLPPNLAPDALIAPTDATGPLRASDYATRGARRQLETLAEPLRREGVSVRTLAVTGDVATRILAVAEEVGAHALVVGTHGRTGLHHLLLGSVAEDLVRRASLPVVCVRTHAPEVRATREESNLEDELAG